MAACAFCGSSGRSTPVLVTAPQVAICADCVAVAGSALVDADRVAPAGGASAGGGSAGRGSRLALRCSFCDRSAGEVRRLVAGPVVRICDLCVHVAEEALEHQRGFVSGS
jgi:ATP-dependent protease Clp ATPase subunit